VLVWKGSEKHSWDETSFMATAMDNKIARRKLVMGAAAATLVNPGAIAQS
jgi:hypothetical protein